MNGTNDGFIRPIRSLSRLFRGITPSHNGDFYCLNCLHSFLEQIMHLEDMRLCHNNDYCNVEMSTQSNIKLKYN